MRSTRGSEDDQGSNGDFVDGERSLTELLDRLVSMAQQAKTVPLSSSILLPKDDLLEMLELARASLPLELKKAQWMLREKQEFLDRVGLEAEEIMQAARARSEGLVAKTEIVRQATLTASNIVQSAKEEASKLKLDASDYADQKLASLEIVLERTLKTIRAGRERLSPPLVGLENPSELSDKHSAELDAFFDQDTGGQGE